MQTPTNANSVASDIPNNQNSQKDLNPPAELVVSSESNTMKNVMDSYINSVQKIDKIYNSNLSSDMFNGINRLSGAFSPNSD